MKNNSNVGVLKDKIMVISNEIDRICFFTFNIIGYITLRYKKYYNL